MILIQEGNDLVKFDNYNELKEYLKLTNVNPLLMRFFYGDFKEVNYTELLSLYEDSFLDWEEINAEVLDIYQNIFNTFKDLPESNNGFAVEKEFYKDGCLKYSSFLRNPGINPVLIIKIQFRSEGSILSNCSMPPEIPTKTVRRIGVQCIGEGWTLLKVQQNPHLKSKMNYHWREYLLFISKEVITFLKEEKIQ